MGYLRRTVDLLTQKNEKSKLFRRYETTAGIARSITKRSPYLILDEPTAGLDPAVAVGI